MKNNSGINIIEMIAYLAVVVTIVSAVAVS